MPAVEDRDWLVRVRKDFGLTQVELAALLGVHPVTVSKWETGRVAVPVWHRSLLRLAWKFTPSYERVWIKTILLERGPALARCLRWVNFN